MLFVGHASLLRITREQGESPRLHLQQPSPSVCLLSFHLCGVEGVEKGWTGISLVGDGRRNATSASSKKHTVGSRNRTLCWKTSSDDFVKSRENVFAKSREDLKKSTTGQIVIVLA